MCAPHASRATPKLAAIVDARRRNRQRETIKNLQNAEHQQKVALDNYLTKLNVE
jgi:hypothetical protein